MVSSWRPSQIAFTIWALLALILLSVVPHLLDGSFPIFTVLWIVVPLMAVLRTKDTSRVGFRTISWHQFFTTTAINLGGLLMLMLLFEPWAHIYQKLLEIVFASQTPDTTFVWWLRFPRISALVGMALYSGLVTLFGEELFFRGWLLQLFRRRLGTTWAVVLQAILFVIPNLLIAFVLPPLQSILYVLVYTWLAIGMLGGWAASRTGSIWPSLTSAVVCNLVLVAVIL